MYVLDSWLRLGPYNFRAEESSAIIQSLKKQGERSPRVINKLLRSLDMMGAELGLQPKSPDAYLSTFPHSTDCDAKLGPPLEMLASLVPSDETIKVLWSECLYLPQICILKP